MNCAVHGDTPATGYCRNCGKALCPQCAREVKGALYCEECLSQRISGGSMGTPASGVPPVEGNAALAAALGFIPGLGAVYNGEYVKAAVHVLIFGGTIAALSSDLPGALSALLGVFLGVFYFYMPIEAYRTAKAKGEAAAAEKAAVAGVTMEGDVPPTAAVSPAAKQDLTKQFNPIGAIILIALGLLFLLNNFGLLREDWVDRGWPFILIAIGVGLLIKRMSMRSE